jgi:hypothetical protein
MLLIYNPAEGDLTPEEWEAERPLWYDYTQGLHSAGVHVAGDALYGVDTATTVRVHDGETQITDGPFAETKEFLAGYYVIEVPDLDAALGHAARIPSAGRGPIEVRPVVDMTQMPGWETEAAGTQG